MRSFVLAPPAASRALRCARFAQRWSSALPSGPRAVPPVRCSAKTLSGPGLVRAGEAKVSCGAQWHQFDAMVGVRIARGWSGNKQGTTGWNAVFPQPVGGECPPVRVFFVEVDGVHSV